MLQFLFDFGALSKHSEIQYIFNMVRRDYSVKFDRARAKALKTASENSKSGVAQPVAFELQ